MSLKLTNFLQSSALVCAHFFSSTSSCLWGTWIAQVHASLTHLPKSGCECPHRWRKSLIRPDIPNLAMLHLFPVICRRSVETKMCSLPNTISSSCHLLCDYSLVIMSGRCRYHVSGHASVFTILTPCRRYHVNTMS